METAPPYDKKLYTHTSLYLPVLFQHPSGLSSSHYALCKQFDTCLTSCSRVLPHDRPWRALLRAGASSHFLCHQSLFGSGCLCHKRWSGHLTPQSRDKYEVFEPLKRGDPSCSQSSCRQTRATPGFGLVSTSANSSVSGNRKI